MIQQQVGHKIPGLPKHVFFCWVVNFHHKFLSIFCPIFVWVLPYHPQEFVPSSPRHPKIEASKGPFDFDDLQGVWFLAESSAKARSAKFGETPGMYRNDRVGLR